MLKEINWPGLDNYTVQPLDMSDSQTAMLDQLRTFMKERRSPGALSGCEVTPGTGLDVKVKPGLVMLPDGKIAYLDVETVVALTAADAVNPRIDRIEAEFTLLNDRTGTNEAGAPVVVVKIHKVTLSSNTGVAAANPTAPAKSAGKISLALVTVAPLAVIVASTAIEVSAKARDTSKEKEDTLASSILNAQAAAINLPNCAVDKTKHKQVVFEGDLYRKDLGQSKTSWVRLLLIYNIQADSWVFIPNAEGEATGVVFTFDQATQKVKYISTDFAGGNYFGEFKFNTRIIER